ncbi:MAG: response regulator transcription factor [Candidatus Omnitrophica bacterium]|nr:response regulator transcription factor [Candidatus Omnitrophota bacterium]MDD5351568.1 response regulator transcription factor [Candidatus Omnitrophota bacterium]MDD5551003.1 response regulator transcription factor [Candidatus Omnitrophota bacterium]
MPKEQILIIEDDKHISKLVKYNAEKAGYDCTAVDDGEEALRILTKQGADLIILDIMLPKTDGFEVCRLIKQDPKLKNIPIIMLTAKGEEVDRIVGLELGADDYVVKPFSPRELVLRIKAILKRGKQEESSKDIIERGNLVINVPKHQVTVNNKEVELTPIEFKLLVTLIERNGRIQSRERLLSDVWDMNADVFTRTVDTHIKRLREKLGKMGDQIETVRGLGYRFKEEDED